MSSSKSLVATARVAQVTSWLFWFVLAASLAVLHAPLSPLSPGRRAVLTVTPLLPESWGFFTRDPKEERVYAYRVERSGLVPIDPVDAGPNPLSELTRTRRHRGVEVAMLMPLIPEAAFRRCKQLESCDLGPAHKIRSPLARAQMCGALVFERRSPTPWSWARRNPNLKLEGRAARVNVKCE